ncbi:MAG: hypothetical protein JNK11_18955 [Alphaproteobacteria bacterium]|nr:hypothetical protein [Alphaproteobacteria bacterium]
MVETSESPPPQATSPFALTDERRDRRFAATILDLGRRLGHQWLAGYDLASGETLPVASSHRREAVLLEGAAAKAAMDPHRRLVLHINRPSSRSFSTADLVALAGSPGIVALIAHGHDGTTYAAARSGTVVAPMRLLEVDAMVAPIAWDGLAYLARAGVITAAEADRLAAHVVNMAFANGGAIAYDVRWSIAMERRIRAIETPLEGVVGVSVLRREKMDG